jgi:hypothetical protein
MAGITGAEEAVLMPPNGSKRRTEPKQSATVRGNSPVIKMKDLLSERKVFQQCRAPTETAQRRATVATCTNMAVPSCLQTQRPIADVAREPDIPEDVLRLLDPLLMTQRHLMT